MLARKAFYLDGHHVDAGKQVVISGDDVRGSMRCGLAAPIRLVEEDDAS